MTGSDVGAAALVLTGILLTGAAVAAGPPVAPAEPPADSARSVQVRAATLVCPNDAGSADWELVSVAAPLAGTSPSRSRAQLLPLEPTGEPLDVQTMPGALVVGGRKAASTVVVTAAGNLAPALTAAQAAPATEGRGRGASVASCLPAGRQWMFVGAGSSVEHGSSLALVNPEPSIAVLDVRIFGPGGVVRTVGAQGVAVAAYSRRVFDLDAMAPARAELAVEVTVTQGRVLAAVRDRWTDALEPAGSDWLPHAAAAARNIVVPGVPALAGDKELVVVNPSTRDASVDVELLGPNGSFQPTGSPSLRLPPGSVLTESLTAAAAGDAVAVRLRSDQPVAAAVRTTTAGRGGRDVAVVPAGDAIQTAAVLPVFAGLRLELLLTNPARQAASAAVTAYAADAEALKRRIVRLGGGTTRALRVPTDSERARPAQPAYVVIRPLGDAGVVGAGSYTGSGPTAGFASSLPMRPALVSVLRPSVRLVLTEPG
jgi:hypothetical protein